MNATEMTEVLETLEQMWMTEFQAEIHSLLETSDTLRIVRLCLVLAVD